ncbi:hypothetical protein EVAR_16592_1 [Eumeta japonica]|uniref:Uncharacterized protein n=1 Tax=Eumeta variegata TaxID=151549 RepID=A0A4C1U4G2_EUMVA|nr:hypothetical protein EVAR_16592_1 [Eumeta japonica]
MGQFLTRSMARSSLLRLQVAALILVLSVFSAYGDTKRLPRSPQYGGSFSQAQAASFGRGPYQVGFGPGAAGPYGPGGYGVGRLGGGGPGFNRPGFGPGGYGGGSGSGSISISKSISISRGGVSSSNAQSSAAGKK